MPPVPISETWVTLAGYRVNPVDGRSVMLETPPYYPANYCISAAGLRIIASAERSAWDVDEIRNFAEILKR